MKPQLLGFENVPTVGLSGMRCNKWWKHNPSLGSALLSSPEVLSRRNVFICLWMVSKIKASAARPGLLVVTFCTGLHLRNGVGGRRKSSEI